MKAAEFRLAGATCFGEGWHNYHHVFPWDYRNAEYWDYKLNFSTLFVDLFACVGWAYDLKTVPLELVAKRVKRTGDGSHRLWGWNDPNVPEVDRLATEIKRSKDKSGNISDFVWGWGDSDIPFGDKTIEFKHERKLTSQNTDKPTRTFETLKADCF